jgi:hypothetical protein
MTWPTEQENSAARIFPKSVEQQSPASFPVPLAASSLRNENGPSILTGGEGVLFNCAKLSYLCLGPLRKQNVLSRAQLCQKTYFIISLL